ncbi:cysteine proteinase [Fomes fomentarius]|nr:cysteine proteinase [Fomes fomentarius]
MSSDTDLDNGKCPHLTAFLADNSEGAGLLNRYTNIIKWKVHRSHEVVYPAKRRKIAPPDCGVCGESLSRPFACLHCQFAGCWREKHIKLHLQNKGHDFCTDIKTGNVFCIVCDDFVYDSAFSDIHSSISIAVEETVTHFQVANRGRERFSRWVANGQELTALDRAFSSPCQGRRGLINLGQTCFMNVILQSFIANPLLRNYYLSDRHPSKLCKTKDCTSCEMDKLYSEVYSENAAPYGPIDLLAKTWRISSELSGYAQQDAHEYFITALNQIHATSRGSTSLQCICIIHSTFAGLLQSDVKCERCGTVADKSDPMLDISLELEGETGSEQDLTLASCLRRFTHPEKLGPNEYSCERCGKGTHTQASKRLSIRKLPPVLSFQFKRFEHKSADKSAARKIEAPVRFPASLNMAPYTTLIMHRQEQLKESGTASSSLVPDKKLGPEALYEYDLFAVVCHEGQIDNGHYTCYARSHDEVRPFPASVCGAHAARSPSTRSHKLTITICVFFSVSVSRCALIHSGIATMTTR